MRRQHVPTATVALVNGLLLHAASRGVPPPDFIARFGLDPALLADVDGRLPLPLVGRIWEEIGDLCGDPDTPLHAAMALRASDDDTPLTVLLFFASPTLGVGIHRFLRFERVHHGESVMELRLDGGEVEVACVPERTAYPPPPAAVLFGLGCLIRLALLSTGRQIPLRALSVRHPEPKDRAPYDAYFGVRVQFGAESDRLRAPREILDYPHPGASAQIARVLEAHARVIESSLPVVVTEPSSKALDAVREAVELLLPDGDATLDRVARALGLSPRTLQRRLEREGTHLRDVVDATRRALALAYIERPTMSLATIAIVLGFSDQAAFHRAFVRWTGRTPGDHRRALWRAR